MICSKQIGQQISAPSDNPIFRMETTGSAAGGGEEIPDVASADSAAAAGLVWTGVAGFFVFLLAMLLDLHALSAQLVYS